MKGITSPASAEAIYIKQISAIRLLTAQQEFELATRVWQGDAESRREMIARNLRLVVSLARRYAHRNVCLADLIEEGNLGLIRAVDKFNPELGYRFSTYATWWIRQNIERAIINYGRDIRLPVHLVKERNTYLRMRQELTSELGRTPSRRELAESTDTDLARLDAMLDYHDNVIDTFDEDAIEIAIDHQMTFENSEWHDPEINMGRLSTDRALHRWLDALTDRQREIVIRRYGLQGHEPDTLENVGVEVGLTRERVRQLQIDALRRLRRMAEREDFDLEELL